MDRASSPSPRWLLAGGGFLSAFWLTYRVLVATPAGQRLDGRLLPRTGEWGGYEQHTVLLGPARWLLALAGDPVLLAVVLGAGLLGGVLGGRVRAALAGGGVVAGALVLAGAAKAVLPRPGFGVDPTTHNSFPSGHVAAVAAVLAAYLLVLPPRARRWCAGAGAVAVAAVTGATMVAGWHRLSDAVGSVTLVAALYCLAAAAVVAGAGLASDERQRDER